ncbi:MAG: FAD-dependent oxidoreductase, partial [Planctomycetes bacterium]|nr:FAD-dependent oxidoreductase [Planctomycetota bacterium]
MKCTKMVLGEPDESGRRRPKPVAGSEFSVQADTVIAAIGQTLDGAGLDKAIELTKRGYIIVNNDTMETSVAGVFSGGDCASGPATVVEAIAAGRRAANSIGQHLNGEPVVLEAGPFCCSKGKLEDIDLSDYDDIKSIPMAEMPVLAAEKRKANFDQVELGLTGEMAKKEAERCLACGCQDAFECELRRLATEYGVDGTHCAGHRHHPRIDESQHPFILFDPNKCILCARCTRTCEEITGVGAIDLAFRGYQTKVSTFGDMPLFESICKSCGECVAHCPVGALMPREPKLPKLPTYEMLTTCPYCGVGCGMYLGMRDGKIVSVRGDRDNPASEGRLCVKGRFGVSEFVHHPERLTTPLIRKNGELVEASWGEALELVAGKLAGYNDDEVAVFSSAKCTNEDN